MRFILGVDRQEGEDSRCQKECKPDRPELPPSERLQERHGQLTGRHTDPTIVQAVQLAESGVAEQLAPQ